jgi:hypothetical protein
MSYTDPPSFPKKEQNPYAPPRSDVGPEPLLAGFTPMPFSIGEVLARSWEIYRARMLSCIGVVFAFLASFAAGGSLYSVAFAALAGARRPLATGLMILLGGPLLAAFALLISIGMIIVMLDIARGREADFAGLFRGGRYLIPIVLGTILLYLMMLGALLVCALPAGLVIGLVGQKTPAGTIVAGLAVVAFYVLIIALSLRTSQFTYLIIDRNAGPLESLRVSNQITRGHAWQILGLIVLVSAINTAGLLACGVGLVFSVPYTILILVVAYLSLAGRPATDPYAKGQLPPDLDGF